MGYVWFYKNTDDIIDEIWKSLEIEGHSFTISNNGRVKSKRNIVSYGTKEDNGYRRVNSNKDGKIKKVFIHILVAKAFIKNDREGETSKFIVNHKDGDRTNNHHDNLEWVTYSENSSHAVNTLGKGPQRKVFQICKITGNVINTFDNITKSSKATGANNTAITHVCRGKFTTANGFIWKYV
jgi:hypothetical protein